MRIANIYNHLNAREYLLVNRNEQYSELQRCIQCVNANRFLKISCDSQRLGKIFYSQSDINNEIKRLLNNYNWVESRIAYYVTGDEQATREIINIRDKNVQREILESRNLSCYSTFNQVDFQKDRIAVEVQFGKYFSVAYDLHVKHTFFYSRNDIDVGLEIIPTKLMEEHMDTGVPWFENEVTNVIREGRTNPPVPILILGIEPDEIVSTNPNDYSDEEVIRILNNSDIAKLKTKIASARRVNDLTQVRIDKIIRCLEMMEENG